MSAPTIASIIDATCEVSGLSRADILSGQRNQRYSRARQAAVYVARIETGHSFGIIGSRISGRTHGATFRAFQKAQEKLASDDVDFQRLVSNVQLKIATNAKKKQLSYAETMEKST